MFLYHHQPNPPKNEEAQSDGFAGFVERNKIYDITWDFVRSLGG
jgi:hypothetical protein